MKVLDLSVAALIGLASVASMAAWNPNQLLAQGQNYSDQASMKEYLASVTSRLGLPWLHTSTPDDVCSALVPFANSSIEVSAEWRNFRCSTGPPPGAQAATITLQFPEGNLTLTAWRPEKQ
jgi:hypothetical protein